MSEAGRFLFSGGSSAMFIRITLYIAPLIGGVITFFFMIKPLLARRGRRTAAATTPPWLSRNRNAA
jgi:hypothetical protein